MNTTDWEGSLQRQPVKGRAGAHRRRQQAGAPPCLRLPFINNKHRLTRTSQVALVAENPSCHYRRRKRRGFDPWVGKIPWRRRWQLTAEFLPGNSHGQGHLAGYSPWDHRVRREPARRVAAAAHDRRILQTMWKCFPDVNCSQSFFLGNLIFFYVSGSPKQAHYWMLIYNSAGYIFCF